jgi:hypothetical protein
VVESLTPDKKLLENLVASHQDSTDPNDIAVCSTATNLLVTAHSDPAAIRRKLRTLIENASPFSQIAGVHVVGPLPRLSEAKTDINDSAASHGGEKLLWPELAN